MSNTVIKIENLSKEYYLGEVGTGTLSHDIHRWWARVRGKEDPYSIVGGVNPSSSKTKPDYILALKDINLEIQEGDIFGIIGKNGAGKSTLLKIISRITAPTTGSVKAKGRIASLLEVGTGMHQELTGRENIYLNGTILGMKQHEIKARFDDIVDFSGCGLFVDTPIKRYSTGMRVRLGFAVAAFLDAEILIVDEVLAVGDISFQKKCLNKMGEIASKGRTILFVSHNIGAISALCSRSIILDHGILTFNGSVEDAKRIYFNNVTRAINEVLIDSDNQPITIEKIAIAERGLGGNIYDINENIEIIIDYVVKQKIIGTNIVLIIKDNYGNIIFRAWDIDDSKILYENRMPGIYSARYTIKNNLLNIGTYTVTIACGQPSKCGFSYHEDIISFEVVATNVNSEEYSYSRGGIIISPGHWRTDYIGPVKTNISTAFKKADFS